ncbi:MAG: hypothetical protein PF505_12430 [Vallitaleaceae bacterium]|jgi:hypothetical protein|nr:hypothetical protein [Vallitaleaceae bacterium]
MGSFVLQEGESLYVKRKGGVFEGHHQLGTYGTLYVTDQRLVYYKKNIDTIIFPIFSVLSKSHQLFSVSYNEIEKIEKGVNIGINRGLSITLKNGTIYSFGLSGFSEIRSIISYIESKIVETVV